MLNDICKETVAFVKNKKDSIRKLKKGQAFIYTTGEKFYFLELLRDKIEFCNENGDIYTSNYLFVKDLLDEINEKVVEIPRLIKNQKNLNHISLDEQIKTGLLMFKEEFSRDETTKFKILELGGIKAGMAYYHEVDQFYSIIGIEIKYRYKFNFMDEEKTDIGFFPIWVGKSHRCAPISFSESYSDHFDNNQYTNGCGDHVEIMTTLNSKAEIDDCIKSIDLSKYSK